MDRGLLARVEREIGVLEVARDERGSLERAAHSFRNCLHQALELEAARGWDRHEPQTCSLPDVHAVVSDFDSVAAFVHEPVVETTERDEVA